MTSEAFKAHRHTFLNMVISACKCTGCNCYRLFIYTCIICLFTCLFVLTCCGYCAYMVYKIQTIDSSGNLNNCDRNKLSPDDVSLQETFEDSISLKYDEETRVKRDEGTRHTAIKEQSESSDNNKRDDGRLEKSRKRRKRKRKSRGKKKVMAAHYSLQSGQEDLGVVCPLPTQRTRKPPNLNHLKHFTPASFVKEKTNPFRNYEEQFIVKTKGLYLVYAQIFFEDCREDQVMILQQKRQAVTIQEHFCVVGVKQSNIKYNNTCSITALFYLEQGDVVTMENYYPEVHINYRSYNNTFIGAVLIN